MSPFALEKSGVEWLVGRDEQTDEDEFRKLLRERGFVQYDRVRRTPLTGGVSGEIYLVEDDERRLVAKIALEKLKVGGLVCRYIGQRRRAGLHSVCEYLPSRRDA